MGDTIVPILLLPEHVKPSSSSLPILKAIQKVLNESYTETYCLYPEIFGTNHVRMADPAQLADIIGTEGFTIVLVRVRVMSDSADQNRQICEVVATGSVKDFGDGDIETYAQWSKNLSGAQWTREAKPQEHSGTTKHSKEGLQKFEVTAFAVSPHCQSTGLGARLLDEIKWLVTSRRIHHITANTMPMANRLGLLDGTSPVKGIDLNRLKHIITSTETKKSDQVVQDAAETRLVLMAIQELGNELYYQKRGFRTIWRGTVPVGMWDCRKDCTMVYMEMELE